MQNVIQRLNERRVNGMQKDEQTEYRVNQNAKGGKKQRKTRCARNVEVVKLWISYGFGNTSRDVVMARIVPWFTAGLGVNNPRLY